MTSKGPSIQVDQSEQAGLERALKLLASLADSELSQGASKASRRIASAGRARLSASSRWGRLAAGSVKASGESVTMGGAGAARPKRSAGDDPSYSSLFFGAEYGVKGDPRWPGHRWKGSGKGAGYGVWPAISAEKAGIFSDWTEEYWQTARRVWSD